MRIEQCKDVGLLGRMKHALTSQIERIQDEDDPVSLDLLTDLNLELLKLNLRLDELAG